ncbi:hypothetical protein KY330_00660 [Candidatus Woesearchaeota archaeon]|nr:hypothetical protein [Candidatus Woesearchaeota archaeon]
MKIEINIKKKHLYIMSIILLLTVGAIASATINPNIGWLPIQRIAKSNEDLTSLDENNNGLIDHKALEPMVIVESGKFFTRCKTITPPVGTSVATHKINYIAGGWAQWTFEASHTAFGGGEITSDSGVTFCSSSLTSAGGYHGSYMTIAIPK